MPALKSPHVPCITLHIQWRLPSQLIRIQTAHADPDSRKEITTSQNPNFGTPSNHPLYTYQIFLEKLTPKTCSKEKEKFLLLLLLLSCLCIALWRNCSVVQSEEAMRNTKAASKQSKIKHMMSAPLRIMSKAKNFYLRNMEDLAGRVGQGGGVGGPSATQIMTLPKSFSVNSSMERDEDEDFRELLRAVSKRRGLDMTGFELRNGYGSNSGNNNVYGVGRSQSVGLGKIGRIDENISADEFEEDRSNLKADSAYPRSRSHAVGRRNIGLY